MGWIPASAGMTGKNGGMPEIKGMPVEKSRLTKNHTIHNYVFKEF
jgi:hypothetical protein